MRLVLAVLAALLLLPSAAHAHTLGYDSIGRDNQLVIEDATRYDTALRQAIEGWERVRAEVGYGPTVRLAEPLEVPDAIAIDDRALCGTGYGGVYTVVEGAPDLISLNACMAKRKDGEWRQMVFSHEIGHSLGFAHPERTRWYRKNSVMHPYALRWRPGIHDREDWSEMFAAQTGI